MLSNQCLEAAVKTHKFHQVVRLLDLSSLLTNEIKHEIERNVDVPLLKIEDIFLEVEYIVSVEIKK